MLRDLLFSRMYLLFFYYTNVCLLFSKRQAGNYFSFDGSWKLKSVRVSVSGHYVCQNRQSSWDGYYGLGN